jgi:hypothetical protein
MGATSKPFFDVYPRSYRTVVVFAINKNESGSMINGHPPSVTQRQGEITMHSACPHSSRLLSFVHFWDSGQAILRHKADERQGPSTLADHRTLVGLAIH